MPAPRDQAVLVRAATLYYLEGKSQAEVAAEIGVSRSNVSRVLAAARELGIVEVRIHDPFGRATGLEAKLMDRFSLTECRVAPSGEQQDSLSRVGELGAQWLLENIPDHGAISLSWGSSVQAVVDAVPNNPAHSSLEILPLVGGLSIVDSARDGNVLVRSLAMKLGAEHRRLHAPAVVQSKETRDAFLNEPSISSVLAAASESKIAIVGIGSVGFGASSAILDSMHLTTDEMRKFNESKAVGDCCTRHFDSNGRPVESPASDHVVSIDLRNLRKIATVVGVAAGAEKAAGVHGALVGRIIDVLIVDTALAQALLAFPAP
ncbi:MAG: sugar-binding transcriptional regulator [Microbacteriaceae bacterium]|nr:MAG: sugar-binding transcriptional regulator [Microbacteriaceae bacterium]